MIPDWSRIAAELRRRESSEITNAVAATGLNLEAFDSALQGREIDDALKTELWSMWRQASELNVCPLVAVYVYARCVHAWELSIDHVPLIGDTIDAVRDAWRSIDRPTGSAALLANVVLEHTGSVKDSMDAENAIQCSCPVATSRYAESVARRSTRLLEELPAPQPGDEPAVHEIVREILRVNAVTYSGVREAASGVLAILESPGAVHHLDRAIDELRQRESHPAVRRHAAGSELRAHRHGLTALRRNLLDPSIPHLEFTEAGFIYIYPFAFDGVSPQQAGETAIRIWGNGAGTTMLAGQIPARAGASELSDIWFWGHRDHPSYGGVTIVMPSFSITTTAGEVIDDYQVEIRLNNLGNHYVRIVSPRAPLILHETYQGLRRGSRYMGEELIRGANGVTWARLREYADAVIDDLAAAIGCGADHVVKDIDADGHVHLQIRDAVVRDDDGGRPACVEDIIKAAGPLLFHPMQSLVASLEEWVRYPLPQRVQDTLEGCAFTDSLGARTDNTTSLFLPGAPNWSWIEYQEVVEFAASVSVLLRLWRHQVDREFRQVHKEIRRHSATAHKLRPESEVTLADLRLSLGDFIAEVRSQRAKLRSDQLVESAAARRFMDNLFQVAELTRLESELDVHVTELDALYERLNSYLGVLQERATRRYQRFIELVLAGVALFSMAELLGLINDLFFTGKKIPAHANIEVAVFVTFAIVVLTSIALARRRS